MNRQIKFRVWTGYSMEYRVLAGALGHFYVEGMSKTDSACLSDANTVYHESAPLMQFTGLLDKNGKEIWEGDIVNFTDDPKPYVIEFCDGIFIGSFKSNWAAQPDEMISCATKPRLYTWMVNPRESTSDTGEPISYEPDLVVIGDIHNNPELLK